MPSVNVHRQSTTPYRVVMADFDFTELFPLGPDTTKYRLVTTEGVSTVETPLGTMLKVDPSAITRLSESA